MISISNPVSVLILGTVLIVPHAQTFIRSPFLQKGGPHGASICWRLSTPAKIEVKYGKDQSALDKAIMQPVSNANGCVQIEKLFPDTKYFYELYNGTTKLANPAEQYFVTHPDVGTRKKSNFWIIGDAGTGGAEQLAVRNAYLKVNANPHSDGLIMLGDNAYEDGTDQELTSKLFKIYPSTMANTFTWPTIGNHENNTQGVGYLAAFDLPTEAESGGVPSKSELFYSYDFGNIHFICLDSEQSGRKKTDPMYIWLEQDLEATKQDWIIVFWHSPPYSWGTHNSDEDAELIDMRTTFVPLLEKHGVDLVYCGHSHNYERSFLLNGAYGNAKENQSQASTVVLDKKSGNPDKEGAYKKNSATEANQGTVYTVAGSSGDLGTVKGLHPMMYVQLVQLGSVMLTIEDNVATSKFIDASGIVKDQFQIIQAKSPTHIPRQNKNGKNSSDRDKYFEFSRIGKFLKFSMENTEALQLYSADGSLIFQEIPKGTLHLSSLEILSGKYFYRFGGSFGWLEL
jgi:acid phosphatase type 7